MCLYPKLIKNPKYKKNKKNGGIIPAINDERVLYVPIGCTNCIECRKQKAREWKVRLQEDIKQNNNAKFITLTFNNESIKHITKELTKQSCKNGVQTMVDGYDLDNQIATWATRHFLERWRKKYKKSLKHWLITELGHNGTENIHLHGIIWTNENIETITKYWQYGWIWQGDYVNNKTINYITKYVTKTDQQHKCYKAKILTSAGIGNNYTKQEIGDWKKNKYNGDKTNEAYKTQVGTKIALPIYYRNKIYTEEEKEKLWIDKLNKQTRWVLGQKIDISKNEIEYNKALKNAQKINKQLGYGSEPTWEEKQYERQRRIIKQKERIQNTKSP